MKKLILIIVLLFSTLFNGSLTSAASGDYDHNELLDYPGYGEAMYESIVEQTTFITGKYTDNKEYVEQSVQQIKDYASFWKNEYSNLGESCYKTSFMNCFGEITERAGAYALTVGDWIKNLFTDYEQVENTEENIESPLAAFFTSGTNGLTINSGFYYRFYDVDKGAASGNQKYLNISASVGAYSKNAKLTIGMPSGYKDVFVQFSSNEEAIEYRNMHNSKKTDVNYILSLVSKFNITLSIYANDNTQVTFPPRPPSNENIRNIKNYINENGLPEMIVPQPKAYLSCPDGTSIGMTINGATFLDVGGNVMQVSKDGTATVDSQICNLGWEKPTVQYIDGTDQVGISTPDGKTIDAETGEQILLDGEIDDSLEGCDGVLCGIGKLLSGLASIAKSIAGLVGKILDGLLALFVPDNLDFVTEEFDKMSAKLTDKFSLLTALKDTITGVFSSGEGGNPLSDINMSLPAAPNTNFNLDTVSFIEPFVPRIKQIISGILFLMTIIYVYRKITGRGGVMEK